MLRLPAQRRQVCYGGTEGGEKPVLRHFLQTCRSVQRSRQLREYERLQHLRKLHRAIELRRKLRDWNLSVKVRQNGRWWLLKRKWRLWRLMRMRRLLALLCDPLGLLRRAVERWRETALFLRAVEKYERVLRKRHFALWRQWREVARRERLRQSFEEWKDHCLRAKVMRKMALLLKCFPSAAFQHWKDITNQRIDLSDLLERIRLRTLREHFMYLLETAQALQEERLLASLIVERIEPPEEIVKVETTPRKSRMQRKAPLDNMHRSCDCVSKVCHGHRPTCSFKVHFRRRLNLCYEEYDSAMVDRSIAKEMNRYKGPASDSPIPEPSPSAFDVQTSTRVKKRVPMSPERKRKIVREKVRGGVKKSEPMSHWTTANSPRHSINKENKKIISSTNSEDVVNMVQSVSVPGKQRYPVKKGYVLNSIEDSVEDYGDDDFE